MFGGADRSWPACSCSAWSSRACAALQRRWRARGACARAPSRACRRRCRGCRASARSPRPPHRRPLANAAAVAAAPDERRFGAGHAQRPFGGGAHGDACLGDPIRRCGTTPPRRPTASRRPTAPRTSRTTCARRRLGRDLDLGDQLVARDRQLVVADEQIGDVDPALAAPAHRAHARAERQQNRRQVHVRIAVREVAAERRHVPDPHVRKRPQRTAHHGHRRSDLRRPLELRRASSWRRSQSLRLRRRVRRAARRSGGAG